MYQVGQDAIYKIKCSNNGPYGNGDWRYNNNTLNKIPENFPDTLLDQIFCHFFHLQCWSFKGNGKMKD